MKEALVKVKEYSVIERKVKDIAHKIEFSMKHKECLFLSVIVCLFSGICAIYFWVIQCQNLFFL